MAEKTPMMRQYIKIKQQHPDCILFFRLGDFYEMFGQDAIEAAKILDITLTARGKGTENETPMCGIPYHSINNYLSKLTKANKCVAICDQISNPSLPGIVKRKVTRIVTPGTSLDTDILKTKENNYLLSIVKQNQIWGFSFCDLATGEFKTAQTDSISEIQNEIFKLSPSEIILPKSLSEDSKILNLFNNIYYKTFDIPNWEDTYTIITSQFETHNLSCFGIENLGQAIQAAGRLLKYLQETQKQKLSHLKKISLYNYKQRMVLDRDTIGNLEILTTNREKTVKGSLFAVIDQTKTPMGGRLLHQWLMHPLIKQKSIEDRLAAVENFYKNNEALQNNHKLLNKISDLERIIGRIGCGRSTPKDLLALNQTLEIIPLLKTNLENTTAKLLCYYRDDLQINQDVFGLIKRTICHDAPALLNQGNIIKTGYNQELDELKEITINGKEFLAKLQQTEIQRTDINSLKIKFNKVFGYYIEISKANLQSVPENYIRKQTLTNAERYITPELKEYEEKILGAQDKIIQIEQKLFLEIIQKITPHLSSLQKQANIIAHIDCLAGLAECAVNNNYTKPQISPNQELIISQGRHPVLETILPTGEYVPNDTKMDCQTHQFILLTGPNMSGKSSYIRQTALIVLLAQIGSFIPAAKASIGIVDRIFTRIGAQDNLAKGQSTFMVEMQEAANILNNATDKSLIILDELGRGTSTYDGVSIAWAISEYIHNHIHAKTLFATHYHELIKTANSLSKAQNYSVAVTEKNDEIIFLRKIIRGGINKSYGIEVAKLAGIPSPITNRAKEILHRLEQKTPARKSPETKQNILPLYNNPTPPSSPILKELAKININQLTPLQAMHKLNELIEKSQKALD